jgi:hypothetical protein
MYFIVEILKWYIQAMHLKKNMIRRTLRQRKERVSDPNICFHFVLLTKVLGTRAVAVSMPKPKSCEDC